MRRWIFCLFLGCLPLLSKITADSPQDLSQELTINDIIICLEQAIQRDTDKIQKIESTLTPSIEELIKTHKNRALLYLWVKNYESALADFNDILDIKSSQNQMEDSIVGSALFGRALCHVGLNQIDEIYQDFRFLNAYFTLQHQEDCPDEAESVVLTSLPALQKRNVRRLHLFSTHPNFCASLLGSAKTMPNKAQIERCIMEYPTLTEVREEKERYENEKLERIYRDYEQALWREKKYGTPVDHEKLKRDVEKLARDLGKESGEAFVSAVKKSASAGLTVFVPPMAIIEAYEAVQDFKRFGARAEEAARLQDLANRWKD